MRWVGASLSCGRLIWLFLLAQVIGLLALWNVIALLALKTAPKARRQSIDGMLFWGGVAAVIGFLGQWIGIHKLTRAVAEMGIVNPRAISIGISESLLTPIAGMAVLVAAALLWLLLRIGQFVRESR